jgi:hypothetical protein
LNICRTSKTTLQRLKREGVTTLWQPLRKINLGVSPSPARCHVLHRTPGVLFSSHCLLDQSYEFRMMWMEVAVAQLKAAATPTVGWLRTSLAQNSSSAAGARSRELLNAKQECRPLDSDVRNDGSCNAGHVTTKRNSCCNCTRWHGLLGLADHTGSSRGA